jgi:hypothetical protein
MIKEKINSILNYYTLTRRIGHTDAILKGANNVSSIILTSNYKSGKSINKLSPNSITLGLEQIDKLRGYKKPLLLDNDAVYSLLKECLEEINKLENKNNDNI